MKILLFIICIFTASTHYGIQLFPSGIKVDFDAPEPPSRKTYLLQRKEDIEQKNLKTYRMIRVINGLMDIPEGQFLGLVFYNKKNKVIAGIPIFESVKLSPDKIFFIDRDSGRRFQGMIDNYLIPKKAVSFGLAYINKKGKVQKKKKKGWVQPFKHPDLNEHGAVMLEDFLVLNPDNNIMLQFEVVGTFENPQVKLGGFLFKK